MREGGSQDSRAVAFHTQEERLRQQYTWHPNVAPYQSHDRDTGREERRHDCAGALFDSPIPVDDFKLGTIYRVPKASADQNALEIAILGEAISAMAY